MCPFRFQHNSGFFLYSLTLIYFSARYLELRRNNRIWGSRIQHGACIVVYLQVLVYVCTRCMVLPAATLTCTAAYESITSGTTVPHIIYLLVKASVSPNPILSTMNLKCELRTVTVQVWFTNAPCIFVHASAACSGLYIEYNRECVHDESVAPTAV